MKYHAFRYHDCIPGPWNNNQIYKIPACGTDSYLSIDGRLSRVNAITEAIERFRSKNTIHGYHGDMAFTLHRADYIRNCTEATIIYQHNLTIQETKER